MILPLLACIGLMWILKYGTSLNRPRSYLCSLHPLIKELFSCSLCLGFWSGAVIGAFCWRYCYMGAETMLFPLASAALSWFADCLCDYIQLQQLRAERDLDTKK